MSDFRDDQRHTILVKPSPRSSESWRGQSSIRPGIFAARSWLTFRGLARLVRRSPKLELIYG